MAALTLKVSESKYKLTLSQLQQKIAQLQNALGQLQTQRQKIERAYTGPQATDAINAIKEDEKQVKRAIEMVTDQRDQIQKYLDSMDTAANKIQGDYSDAMKLAKDVFN